LRVNDEARAVECALRYFRSWELQEFAEQSDTTRSLRNRIVHDYLPKQSAEIFGLISGVYCSEHGRLATDISASQSD
jgi:hypothetical protein